MQKFVKERPTNKLIENVMQINKFNIIERDLEMKEAQKSRQLFRINYCKLLADGLISPIDTTQECDFADKEMSFTYMGVKKSYTQKYYG